MAALEREDVQGLVLSGYAAMRYARYLFLRVATPDAARRWVAATSERVTPGVKSDSDWNLNVAFTGAGLRALGMNQPSLDTFPAPFQDGMDSTYRQRILGDVGPSAAKHWLWGGPDGDGDRPASRSHLHVVLFLFAKHENTMDTLLDAERMRFRADGAFEEVRELEPWPLSERDDKPGIEHFGFADGISQPVVRGSGQDDGISAEDAQRRIVATGEFVLGYDNGYGKRTPSPVLRVPGGPDVDLGVNGTYLVFRQLAQDVAAFNNMLDEATRDPTGGRRPDDMERLAAKFVGRWRSGAPLVRSPHRDDADLATDNAFGYAVVDPHGDRCPIGAHIRRTNPRDSLGPEPRRALERANLHRLLRRGRSYGPPPLDPFDRGDTVERGLFFICINANIERQFEFVQQTWCNNPKFAGLYDEQDPLLGSRPPDGGTFTMQGSPLSTRVRGLDNFVTTRGGGYFFVPGLRGLRQLGTMAR